MHHESKAPGSHRSMRLLHRWLASCAVLFLTIIAATGVYMQVDTLRGAYNPAPRLVVPQALVASEISHWLDTALTAAQRAQPQQAIALVSLRMDGARPRADVIWATPDVPALSIDPRTGDRFEPHNLLAADQKFARLILQLHRGDLLGLPGRWVGLVCGITLLTLVLTGLIMYLKIYIQRTKLRRWSPFW